MEKEILGIPYREICRLNIVIARRCCQTPQLERLDVIVSDIKGEHSPELIVDIINQMIGADFLRFSKNPRGVIHIAASDKCQFMAEFSEHHVAAWDLIDYAWNKESKKGIIITGKLPSILQSEHNLLNAGMVHLVACGFSKKVHEAKVSCSLSYDRMDLQPTSQSALTSPELLLQSSKAGISVTTTNNFNAKNQANSIANENHGSKINQNISQQIIQNDVPDDIKELLESLSAQVTTLTSSMPEEKQQDITRDLQQIITESSEERPKRKWYDVSAEGLLEASQFTKEFAGNIGSTILNIGRKLFGDSYKLPEIEDHN